MFSLDFWSNKEAWKPTLPKNKPLHWWATPKCCSSLKASQLACLSIDVLPFVPKCCCFAVDVLQLPRGFAASMHVTAVTVTVTGYSLWKKTKHKQLIQDDNKALRSNINIIKESIWHACLKWWGLQMASTKQHLIMWAGTSALCVQETEWPLIRQKQLRRRINALCMYFSLLFFFSFSSSCCLIKNSGH